MRSITERSVYLVYISCAYILILCINTVCSKNIKTEAAITKMEMLIFFKITSYSSQFFNKAALYFF